MENSQRLTLFQLIKNRRKSELEHKLTNSLS
jgi:hypothetical protein